MCISMNVLPLGVVLFPRELQVPIIKTGRPLEARTASPSSLRPLSASRFQLSHLRRSPPRQGLCCLPHAPSSNKSASWRCWMTIVTGSHMCISVHAHIYMGTCTHTRTGDSLWNKVSLSTERSHSYSLRGATPGTSPLQPTMDLIVTALSKRSESKIPLPAPNRESCNQVMNLIVLYEHYPKGVLAPRDAGAWLEICADGQVSMWNPACPTPLLEFYVSD